MQVKPSTSSLPLPGKTEFFLIRHGQTEYNRKDRACGRLDPDLNAVGIRQAQSAAAKLVPYGDKIGLIVHSSQKRSIQTAKIIAQALFVPMQKDPRLCEQDLGDLEGAHWPDVLKVLQTGAAPAGGESRETFTRRVWQAICAWAPAIEQPRRVLFVAHGGTFFASGFRWGLVCQAVDNAVPHYVHMDDSREAPFQIWKISPDICTSVLSTYKPVEIA